MATAEASEHRAPRNPAPRPRRSGPPAPTRAYLLHGYPWSESSLVLDLFTREHGRVAVVARGAKRPTSQWRSLLLPFAPVQVQLGRASRPDTAAAEEAAGDVLPLRSAEWLGGVPLMPAAALLQGCYCNELLMKLLARQDPHPALFDAYADSLVALAGAEPGSAEEAAVLRAFELLLLRHTGHLPELGLLTQTAAPLASAERHALVPDLGLAQDPQGALGATWCALESALAQAQAAQPAALRQALLAAGRSEAAAVRGSLRGWLHNQCNGQPLRTRQVWRGLQRLAEHAPATPLHTPA
jgi:DNA repair protein RecO (recombination protein O)